jgi:FkbM family methyltransferase
MNYHLIKDIIQYDTNSILDIGAHFGEFTKNMYSLLPFKKYFMLEANKDCEPKLKEVGISGYAITLLSDIPKTITYYKNKTDLTSTGNSYYRELTPFFSDENVITDSIQSTTLDLLFPNETYDFIKIDTQGSELDILKGGLKLISNTKYILLECSVQPYNQDAPMIDDVYKFMDSIGFKELIKVGEHAINGQPIQQDILFTKK